jgi:methylmalonyl-CoA/ethylmalonyl-CoA epimerase
MSAIRRLDHVAVAVRDTERAMARIGTGLGLRVASTEELEAPRVRLTYLDCGNAFIQLVEPLDEHSPLARFLAEHGEGLHHICFGVDDVRIGATELSPDRSPPVALGSGRGRASAFVAAGLPSGVRLEVTEFRLEPDVELSPGWLPPTHD